MAHLHRRTQSYSDCKNPIPGPTQKRLLSKGGPLEASKALLMTVWKTIERKNCLCFADRLSVSRKREEEDEEEEANVFRKTRHPSSKTSQYENTLRLSAPRTRSRGPQEPGSLHTPLCENNCPIWHVDPRVRNVIITARLLQLSQPKQTHPDYRSNRESAASIVSLASRTARISQRLAQLSLPKLKQSNICYQLGRFEEPIWIVSRAAKKASASVRVETLAAPKQLHQDYIPPQEPEWSLREAKTNKPLWKY
ncbi:uncharacterized protein spmap2l isoform X2 [Poecilia reticulata]|uniref:uncharacterized protein spmap2l isoform X2 n=1 Tax=Poecilia reticulata TaxID=8081 RepID=UPI0004A397B1|nr:PREDICTED: testicular haploid expressed gene protein-like isoform X2 [Poecilia reticulata]